MGERESFHTRSISDHLDVGHDIENDRHLSDASPEEAASQVATEQEDVWEDEEENEGPFPYVCSYILILI